MKFMRRKLNLTMIPFINLTQPIKFGAAVILFANLSLSLSTMGNVLQKSQVPSVPGEFLIGLKENVNMNFVSTGMETPWGTFKNYIPLTNTLVVTRPTVETFEYVESSILEDDRVEYVEPNYIYSIDHAGLNTEVTPNDPSFKDQWSLFNDGRANSKGNSGLAGVDIDAKKAWAIQTGSRDIIVGVLDTGVNFNDENLKDNMWTNYVEQNGLTGIDDDKNGYIDDIHGINLINKSGNPIDDNGHGSHCAGVIGARGNDGIGMTGINWNVRIMAIKFLDAKGAGSISSVTEGIAYAIKNKVQILSNSYSGPLPSETVKNAISKANKAGILFVAAAGNSTSNNDLNPVYPANYEIENVVSVAAIGNTGNLSSFSNFGRKTVHVGAPGENILSVTLNGLNTMSGTSMATPHVAGIAALVLAQEKNLKPKELKSRIMNTTAPLADLKGKTAAGLVNAYNALINFTPVGGGIDENDLTKWNVYKLGHTSISSPHPYSNGWSKSWSITVPNAKEVAIFFDKFQTENEDFVVIQDMLYQPFQTIKGKYSGKYSIVVPGNTVRIYMETNGLFNNYGFDITKVVWQ
ncbi:MAG: S8 family serine peptidase [Pseudobdellovibrionaceae bacterium]